MEEWNEGGYEGGKEGMKHGKDLDLVRRRHGRSWHAAQTSFDLLRRKKGKEGKK
jgi:hypothetical protein